jgi:hypothetical protein
VKSSLIVAAIASLLAGCATTSQVAKITSNPVDEEVVFTDQLEPLPYAHWVVIRAKIDTKGGNIVHIDGANTKGAVDCLNKSHQITKERTGEYRAPVEIRVCRQIGADGMPLDEDKIDSEGKVLPQDRGDPQEKKDNTI